MFQQGSARCEAFACLQVAASMFYARQGGPAAVAPHAADPSNKHDWDANQRALRRRLAATSKLTDQSEPSTLVDTSLHRGRERSRAFQENERHREVGKENRKLMGALKDIAQKPCVTLRRVETDPWLPRIPVASNKEFYRKKRQQALDAENEAIVKRLLKIQTTFDRKADEREYKRHKQAVRDMKKVPPPPPAQQRERKPWQLPQLQDIPRDATFDTLFSAPPAEPTSTSDPSMRSAAARSMPSLPTKHQATATLESDRLEHRMARRLARQEKLLEQPVQSMPQQTSQSSDALVSTMLPSTSSNSNVEQDTVAVAPLQVADAVQEAPKMPQRQAAAAVDLAKPNHRQSKGERSKASQRQHVAAATVSKPPRQQQTAAVDQQMRKSMQRHSAVAKQKPSGILAAGRLVPNVRAAPAPESHPAFMKFATNADKPTLDFIAEQNVKIEPQSSTGGMQASPIYTRDCSPVSSLLWSPMDVGSPGGTPGRKHRISYEANSEVAAEVVQIVSSMVSDAADFGNTKSSTWYGSKNGDVQSARTVHSSGIHTGDRFFDGGCDRLGHTAPEDADASALNPTELWPSWFSSDAEPEQEAGNELNALEDLQ